jgi:hypothetical protein
MHLEHGGLHVTYSGMVDHSLVAGVRHRFFRDRSRASPGAASCCPRGLQHHQHAGRAEAALQHDAG